MGVARGHETIMQLAVRPRTVGHTVRSPNGMRGGSPVEAEEDEAACREQRDEVHRLGHARRAGIQDSSVHTNP